MKKAKSMFSRAVTAGMAAAVTFACCPAQASADDFFDKDITPVEITAETFPDPVFRRLISGPDYDKNGDGILSAEEIGYTRNIHCDGMDIESLKGIEYFTELRGLYCTDNDLAELDVTGLKELQGLWCSGNKRLTELDITQNSELLWVYCHDCDISELDVSQNKKMAFIECNTNPISELDLSNNPELEHLMCGTCKLTELDLSANSKLAHLDAFQNDLSELDLSHNLKMKRLDIWNNPKLHDVDVSMLEGLQYYNCAYNGVTEVDVTHNPELNKLSVAYNSGLTKLDLSNNPKLVYLDCAICGLEELDLSHNPNIRFLQAFTNPFTTLDIGWNPFLIQTYEEGEKKAEYKVCDGHSWTIFYGGEDSTQGDNKFFLCFDDAVTLKTEPHGDANKNDEPYKYPPLDEGVTEADLITREQAVQTLYEMAGKPEPTLTKSRFKDVKADAWYADALLWGEENAICVGFPTMSADKFGIGESVTRQDLVLMLMRYTEYAGYQRSIDFGRSDDYMDYYDVDYDHWEAICWSATWHIMEGKGEEGASKDEQRIDPLGRATHAEFEEMLKNLFYANNVNEQVKIAEVPDNGGGNSSDNSGNGTDNGGNGTDNGGNGTDNGGNNSSDKTDGLLGDVNNDTKINSADIAKTAAHIKGIKILTDAEKKRADVNTDTKVNAVDITKIAAHIKGIKTIGK